MNMNNVNFEDVVKELHKCVENGEFDEELTTHEEQHKKTITLLEELEKDLPMFDRMILSDVERKARDIYIEPVKELLNQKPIADSLAVISSIIVAVMATLDEDAFDMWVFSLVQLIANHYGAKDIMAMSKKMAEFLKEDE